MASTIKISVMDEDAKNSDEVGTSTFFMPLFWTGINDKLFIFDEKSKVAGKIQLSTIFKPNLEVPAE